MYLVFNCTVRSSVVEKCSPYAKRNAMFRNPLYANIIPLETPYMQIGPARKVWLFRSVPVGQSVEV